MSNRRVLMACLMTVGVATAQQPAANDFATEIRAGFAAWDTNGDKLLSLREVETQISDAKVTGRAAAALAAVQTYQHGPIGKRKPVALDFLVREAVTATAQEVKPAFELRYRDSLTRVQLTSRTLYGTGAPGLDGLRQGHIGDCYFVAVVGAIVHQRPETVKGWMDQQADQSINVRFPLGAKATVVRVTDGELALTSFAGKQGMWINVLEKAFGGIMAAAYPNAADRVSIDSIAAGGTPVQTMRMLTGIDPDVIMPRLDRKEVGVASVAQALATCEKKKLIACAGSPATGNPPGVDPTHAYAILGYDETKAIVRLWNPHGNDFEPKGPEGRATGYKTRGGRFEMPVADFASTFNFLVCESQQSLRK